MDKNSSTRFFNIIHNNCAPKDLDSFLEEISKSENEESYLKLISSVLEENTNGEAAEETKARLKKRFLSICNSQEFKLEAKVSGFTFIKMFYRYAAVILLSLSLFGGFFYITHFQKKTILPIVNIIKPGGNNAILTLSNGKKISLTNTKSGELASVVGVSIIKTKDGELIYKVVKDSSAASNNIDLAINTLETPRGGQYQIILEDGSKVWLNASSSLKFPPSFAKHKQRIVELSGEAYFEVAKDKNKPFKVISPTASNLKEEIEVLGTHFNINNYQDEHFAKTTLLEGSINVKTVAGSEILKPGQQLLSGNNSFKVRSVDVEDVIAWKNGYFIFENEIGRAHV